MKKLGTKQQSNFDSQNLKTIPWQKCFLPPLSALHLGRLVMLVSKNLRTSIISFAPKNLRFY